MLATTSAKKSKPLNHNKLVKQPNQAGLKAFFSITREWGLTHDEQRKLLGNPNEKAFVEWKSRMEGELEQENKDRILRVLRIYRSLDSLYSSQHMLVWLKHKNKNPLFNKRSPIEHMLIGRMSALSDVCNYLDWVQD